MKHAQELQSKFGGSFSVGKWRELKKEEVLLKPNECNFFKNKDGKMMVVDTFVSIEKAIKMREEAKDEDEDEEAEEEVLEKEMYNHYHLQSLILF